MSEPTVNRARVLVLVLAEISSDARVLRQIDFLASEYDVVVAAFGSRPPLDDGLQFIALTRQPPGRLRRRAESAARVGLRLAGSYRSAYWLDARARRWRAELAGALPVAAIVVNDIIGLPLAQAVGGDVPIVFDAHEHWTSESASWSRRHRLSMRRAHEWILDTYVPRTAGMMTVSPGIARDFEERTNVSPRLVTNAPFFQALRPSAVTEPIRLVHIGVADERRRLEDTIEAVRLLGGRFTLDLVLARDNDYRLRLERLAASEPGIRVLPAVPVDELLSFANTYDVGVFLLPARFPNQVHVLPNKLFDYIQARLAVAIGPSQEMAAVVREWNCGVISESFTAEAFAASLAELDHDEVSRLKANSDRAAHVLTAENNRDVVLEVVREAVSDTSVTNA